MPKNFLYPAKSKSLKSNKSVLLSKTTLQSIRLALKEDVGGGDKTSDLLIPASAKGTAKIISKSSGVFSGVAAAQAVCRLTGVKAKFFVKEGSVLKKNQKVIELSGKVRPILKTERLLLNLIGHLSGIAMQTQRFVHAVKGTKCKILDTRKTTPLWRELEKAAVRSGGGFNHRFGLDDYILVKENHRCFGDLKKLKGKFEIEVRDFDELIEAFDLGAEVVMLDHFTPAQAQKAVQIRGRVSPQTLIEASGNMNPNTVRAYALAGVDAISVGALTHSVFAHDFSLLMKRS